MYGVTPTLIFRKLEYRGILKLIHYGGAYTTFSINDHSDHNLSDYFQGYEKS
ncbi:hypothetical protein SAMN04488055_4638 [Chitinophaga niabensis]|uniref:Uncharacterized protein n=1 Tax=Chitinophaga niabensis TaxID=536979 RepID=A0A1N6JXQ2_9BACT|nr:hypothetical protein SAMN04488055_4638 [Chitinophaga niabensis]